MPYKLLLAEIFLLMCGATVYVHGFFSSVLLAEEASQSTSTTVIGALVGGFTMMTGLLAWVVKHLLDTTVPEMQKNFQMSLDRQGVANSETAKLFQQTMQETQKGFRDDIGKMSNNFLANEVSMRSLFEKKMTEEHEFFTKELQGIIGEFRIDRERFFDAIVTNPDHHKS